MFASLQYIVALALLLVATTTAQSVYFTQYPTEVVNGQSYPVSWASGLGSVTLELLRGGSVEETIYSGSGTSTTWSASDEATGGTNYALRLTPQSNTAAALTSGDIWVIEDEDGLTVNGQQITASVANGPTPSGLSSAAASSGATTASSAASAASSANSASGVAATAASNGQAQTSFVTETVAFTSAGASFTFTTTVAAQSTNIAADASETLVFTSGGQVFTTTIPAVTASPTSTDSAGAVPNIDNYGGLSAGAIAGIVIGVTLIILIVLGIFWFRKRRQRQRLGAANTPDSPITAFIKGGKRALSNRKTSAATGYDDKAGNRESLISPVTPNSNELEGGAVPVPVGGGRFYGGSAARAAEVDSVPRHEMNAMPPTYELAAEEVPRERGDTTRYPATCVSLSRAGTAAQSGSTLNV